MRSLIVVCLLLLQIQLVLSTLPPLCYYQCHTDRFCKPGQRCMYYSCGSRCVYDRPPVGSCATTVCRYGEGCVETSTGPRCVRRLPGPRPSLPSTRNQFCFLPLDDGFCDDDFPRFYYNHLLGNCLPFRYRGCGGNRNNFYSYNDCMNSCNIIIFAD